MATRRKKATADNTATVEEVVNSEVVAEKKDTKPAEEFVKPSKPRRVPLDTIIGVVNNCPNTLIYVSKHITGRVIEWSEYGDIQYIELSELNYMRNTDPKFFSNNWIIIEESNGYTPEEIYNTIGVDRFYRNAVTPMAIDNLLEKSAAEIKERMQQYTPQTRRSVYERAVVLMNAGRFDSISKLNVIKEEAGVADIIDNNK